MNVTDRPSLTSRDLSRLLAAGAIIGPCCEIMLNEVFQGYPLGIVDAESFGFRYIEGFGDFPTTTLTQAEWLAVTMDTQSIIDGFGVSIKEIEELNDTIEWFSVFLAALSRWDNPDDLVCACEFHKNAINPY